MMYDNALELYYPNAAIEGLLGLSDMVKVRKSLVHFDLIVYDIVRNRELARDYQERFYIMRSLLTNVIIFRDRNSYGKICLGHLYANLNTEERGKMVPVLKFLLNNAG